MNNLHKILANRVSTMHIDIGVRTLHLTDSQGSLRFYLRHKLNLRGKEAELRVAVSRMVIIDMKSRFV